MKELLLDSDLDEIIEKLGNVASEYAGKTILIAGGTGFLGRYFLSVFSRLNEAHLDKPCHVIAIDNLITSSKHSDFVAQFKEVMWPNE